MDFLNERCYESLLRLEGAGIRCLPSWGCRLLRRSTDRMQLDARISCLQIVPPRLPAEPSNRGEWSVTGKISRREGAEFSLTFCSLWYLLFSWGSKERPHNSGKASMKTWMCQSHVEKSEMYKRLIQIYRMGQEATEHKLMRSRVKHLINLLDRIFFF